MFRYQISLEALLLKENVYITIKHLSPRVFIVVDVFYLTSNWNLDFKHPVVLHLTFLLTNINLSTSSA
jgi:hypothetical protein